MDRYEVDDWARPDSALGRRGVRHRQAPAQVLDKELRELCHDLLQPAATIAAVVAAAEVESDLTPAVRERLRQVTVEAGAISELCRDVLLGSGRQRDRSGVARDLHGGGYGEVSLDELAAEVAAAASVTWSTTVTAQVVDCPVRGDRSALRRALCNLVANAVRSAGDGGTVHITVAVESGSAWLTVEDSGSGFGKSRRGVAGLGLQIVERVARDHDGALSIGASSKLPGAAVTLRLPSAASLELRDAV